MRESLAKLDFEPERIIATFHGMPEKYFAKGDPYHCHCQKTSRLLRDALGWPADRWLTTFQSRFGNDPWLQPYTDKTVERLAAEGIKKLALVAPGFSADCLETLEELDGENRHIFEGGGGEKFAYLPRAQRQRAWRGRHRGRGAPRALGLAIGIPTRAQFLRKLSKDPVM